MMVGDTQMTSDLSKVSRNDRPLAVCLNDCEIDSGQHDPELKRVCFMVRCAFAEMRWGCGAPEELPQITEQRSGAATFAC